MEFNKQTVKALLGVVCGGIAFCVYFLFLYDKEKKEEPHDSHPAEG